MAWQIHDLADYIRTPHNRQETNKIECAGSRGFLTGTHSGQVGEMIAVASEATHTNNPVTHYMISWREGENPTRPQVEECVDILLEVMGLVGHQCIYALHGDTDCKHLHIAVNRYNEELAKVIRPNGGFDIKQGHKAIAVMAHRQGWSSEKNALYAVENGELVRIQSAKKIQPSSQAQDFEHKTGAKSAERIAQEKAIPALKDSSSWQDLHARMAEAGLRYVKKGSGAVIMVGDIAVKASNVHRALSMAKLKKVWGDFVPSDDLSELCPLPPQPISAVNIEEWQTYQDEMAQVDTTVVNEEALQKFEEEKRKLDEEICKQYDRCEKLGKEHGQELRRIARYCVKEGKRIQRNALWRAYQKDKRRPQIKMTFAAWLKQKGYDKQADLWRHRASIDRQSAPSFSEKPLHPDTRSPQLEMFQQYAEAIKADRFRVTTFGIDPNDGQKRVFIMDKKDGQSKGFTSDELRTQMGVLIDINNQGENIHFTPLSDTMHHIVVDNMPPIKYSQFLQSGFAPSIILKTSLNSYQCVLSIPKKGAAFDDELANRLSTTLNEMFGSPGVSGALRHHLAPGFSNKTPKYQRPDGTYPEVKLVSAQKCQCGQTQELAEQIRQEMEQESLARKQKQWQRCLAAGVQPDEATNAYFAHLYDIKDRFAGDNMDLSRVDAMIALRMRMTGHSEESICHTIEKCAPTIRKSDKFRRHWADYAKRASAYAFGTAGDIEMEKNAYLHQQWVDIEDNAEPLLMPESHPPQNTKVLQEQQKDEDESPQYTPAFRIRMR